MESIQSDLQHLNKFIMGFESLKEKRHVSASDLSSVERYAVGVMKADGVKLEFHSGNEGFIASAGKKVWEVIKRVLDKIFGLCASIKNRITGLLKKDSPVTKTEENNKEDEVKKEEVKKEEVEEEEVKDDKKLDGLVKKHEEEVKENKIKLVELAKSYGHEMDSYDERKIYKFLKAIFNEHAAALFDEANSPLEINDKVDYKNILKECLDILERAETYLRVIKGWREDVIAENPQRHKNTIEVFLKTITTFKLRTEILEMAMDAKG